jgi:DNA recombination protein RmuC
LEEILAPEQYEKNVVTVEGTQNPVEFAVKLPGVDENKRVYLPIDAKFPADAYVALTDAYDKGIPEDITSAKAVLVTRIKKFADDIKKKYISPPATTDFAVMFLPTEGLYAEAVRLGLVEILQKDYNVTIAGPTTMAALLNSLQMGFKTLAIQKRSGEVWNTLSAVKTEFGKFEEVLISTQKRLEQATGELENLVGVRTRQIRRKLREVSELPDDAVDAYLPVGDTDSVE